MSEESKSLSTTPLVELILEVSKLEQEIDLKILKYNLLSAEIIRRFPTPEIKEEFKPKTLIKGGIK